MGKPYICMLLTQQHLKNIRNLQFVNYDFRLRREISVERLKKFVIRKSEIQNINLLSLILTPLRQDGAFISRVPVKLCRKPDMPSNQKEQNAPVRCRCGC